MYEHAAVVATAASTYSVVVVFVSLTIRDVMPNDNRCTRDCSTYVHVQVLR